MSIDRFVSVLFLDNEPEDDVEDVDDDDDDYNRYPIILDLSKNPFDNLQLQQNYNDEISPLDDDENLYLDEQNNDDEQQLEQYPIAYEPETLREVKIFIVSEMKNERSTNFVFVFLFKFSEAPIENYF